MKETVKYIHPSPSLFTYTLCSFDKDLYEVSVARRIVWIFQNDGMIALWFQPIPPTDTKEGEDYDDWKWQARKEFYSKHPWEKMDMFMFRDLIEKHMPKPVEQELIPLLPRDIVAITDEIITLEELGKVDEDRIHQILSKYWVHKQEEKTATELQVIQREREHELIQAYEKWIKDVSDKKFTKQYVREKMSEFPCVTSYIINQTYKFLEIEWLLQD